jgi:hypothetical protein
MVAGDTCGESCTVFVSSSFFTGDLVTGAQTQYPGTCSGVTTGLDAGDCICQTLADNALLDGTYKAWLSDDTMDARDRLTQANVPYIRVDGEVVVANSFADLVDGSLMNPIFLTEDGGAPRSEVWTGTRPDGTAAPDNCANWTSQSNADLGTVGAPFLSDVTWTERFSSNCDNELFIYCIEQ